MDTCYRDAIHVDAFRLLPGDASLGLRWLRDRDRENLSGEAVVASTVGAPKLSRVASCGGGPHEHTKDDADMVSSMQATQKEGHEGTHDPIVSDEERRAKKSRTNQEVKESKSDEEFNPQTV